MTELGVPTIDIALWGETAVGKTTALSAYLCQSPPRPGWVDRRAAESQETLRLALGIWNHLRANRLPAGTVRARYLAVRHRGGALVRFRDVKGGNTRDPSVHSEDADALCSAQAAILFVEWPTGADSVAQAIAAENALVLLGDRRPVALAITKAELGLSPDQLVLFGQRGPARAARDLGLPREFVALLERIDPGAVFPMTVYGYQQPSGRPAHFLDELGRRVPYGIRPMFVEGPFDHLIDQVIDHDPS